MYRYHQDEHLNSRKNRLHSETQIKMCFTSL
jgi:hypothetical protein